MNKGKFITIEGCDGCGKSTITSMVVTKLIENGYDVVHTREPGGIDIAEQIRNVILDPKNTAMEKRCEALLYAASRRQHLVEKVIPAIEQGKIVICERFVDSSLAYQGYARGIGIDEVWKMNQFAIEDTMPDATIFMDVPFEVGLKRIENRAGKDRLDVETSDFHQRVYDGFQEVLRLFNDRIIVVDANRSIDEVFNDVYSKVVECIHG